MRKTTALHFVTLFCYTFLFEFRRNDVQFHRRNRMKLSLLCFRFIVVIA